jgi:hypothetical protein
MTWGGKEQSHCKQGGDEYIYCDGETKKTHIVHGEGKENGGHMGGKELIFCTRGGNEQTYICTCTQHKEGNNKLIEHGEGKNKLTVHGEGKHKLTVLRKNKKIKDMNKFK